MNEKQNKTNELENGLYLVATPIGNLEDISKRAELILKKADLIICENPIHSIKLLNKLGIKKKLLSLHDYNEEKVINKITKYQNNKKIALISDAGSPLISDPGFNLVQSYIQKNLFVTSIPGPSSVISALQISGAPIDKFIFCGFAPKGLKKIQVFLEEVSKLDFTSVFFVSGKNLENLFKIMVNIFSSRNIIICKELTKLNEGVFRGEIIEIYEMILNKKINTKGEFTIVLSRKKSKKKTIAIDENVKIHIKLLLKKYSLTEVVQIVHNLTEISKKDVYQLALEIKNE